MDHITQLIADGWAVIPIPRGEKGPRDPGWRTKTYGPHDFTEADNVGVKNGEPSGDRVDVDLDAPEALVAADLLLPFTACVHGRPGKPRSHRWYHAPGAKTVQRRDLDNTMLVELRSTGGQTVVPPSVHPSGETLVWDNQGDPPTIDPTDLLSAVNYVAIAALLARHWPKGSRHAAALSAGGFLARCGIEPMFVERIVRAAARAARDEEVEDRARAARESAEKAAGGDKVTGGPSLAADLGEPGPPIVKRILYWLDREGDDEIQQLNAKHFIVRLGREIVVGTDEGDEVYFQTFAEFPKRYWARKIPQGKRRVRLGDAWLESPQHREYAGKVVFAPPPRVCRPEDYNLWKGFAVEPGPGAGQSFLDHIHEIICSGVEEYTTFMLDLLAATVQRPGDPLEVAVVLRGKLGTGKGAFVREVMALFGPRHAIQVDKQKHITGHFNQHLSGKVVVFADEAVWAGNRSEIGALKRLITEPTITIERKGLDAVSEPNCIHLFMATNERWAVPASFEERRFFVLDVSDRVQQNEAYFARLHADMAKRRGREALLRFLLDRNLEHRSLRRAPRTDALREQQELSADPEVRWWKEKLYAGRVLPEQDGWPTWVACEQLYEDYLRVVGAALPGARRAMETELGVTLRRLLPPSARRRRRQVTLEIRRGGQLIPVRGPRYGWDIPPLAECRAAFDRAAGTRTPWPEVEAVQPGLPAEEAEDDNI